MCNVFVSCLIIYHFNVKPVVYIENTKETSVTIKECMKFTEFKDIPSLVERSNSTTQVTYYLSPNQIADSIKQEIEQFLQTISKHNRSLSKLHIANRKQLTTFTYFYHENIPVFRELLKHGANASDWNRSDLYKLKEPEIQYFKKIDNQVCFTEGTDLNLSQTAMKLGSESRSRSWTSGPPCKCKNGWSGCFCSIPTELQASGLSADRLANIKPRLKPKTIVNCVVFNMEFEMMEIRLAEIGDVVDLFLIAESNYTAYGDPKPLYLLSALKKGFLQKYHHKIFYVLIGKVILYLLLSITIYPGNTYSALLCKFQIPFQLKVMVMAG